jgi:hypothetical protein
MSKQRGWLEIQRNKEYLKFISINAAISTFLGMSTWMLSVDADLSLLIGLISSILLLILELRAELDTIRRNITTVIGIQQETLENHDLRDAVNKITFGYAEIVNHKNTFFSEQAQHLITRCAASITEFREGLMNVSPENIFFAYIYLMKEAEHSLTATSFVKINNFWFRGGGKEYEKENFLAVKRKVKITRIYILEDIADMTTEVEYVIRNQMSNGIKLYVAFVNNLRPDLLHDIALFDNRYVMYLDLVPGSKYIRAGKVYSNELELHKAKIILDEILRDSEEASSFLQRHSSYKTDDSS